MARPRCVAHVQCRDSAGLAMVITRSIIGGRCEKQRHSTRLLDESPTRAFPAGNPAGGSQARLHLLRRAGRASGIPPCGVRAAATLVDGDELRGPSGPVSISAGVGQQPVGLSIGLLRGGLVGGFLAWLGFTLPSGILMMLCDRSGSLLAAVGCSSNGRHTR